MKKSLDWTIMEEFVGRLTDLWENENWQKVNHHDHTTAKKKDVAETTGDPKFDKMLKGITGKKAVAKQQKADTKQQARDAFGSMFGGGNPADKLKIKEQGMAEATPRHFGPKGAGTELARQIRANGELDRNKQPEPTGIPKKNEFTITEPKAKIQVKKNKGVAENEIPGHSMGFTGGVGPGLQSNVAEAPIELDRDNPMASTIHSHQGANPGSIEYRIMRARRQLRDLAEQAESDSPLVWQHIARLFPELAMNIEQINHGLGELKNIRSKGGKNSRNIPALEAVMPPIKAAKPTAPKTVKPKAKTSACKAGQVQTGMQIKDGKSVPKCSVTKK